MSEGGCITAKKKGRSNIRSEEKEMAYG